MFLRATLADGKQVVSEFSSLGRVERYANQVFTGSKPFNAWRVVGTTHPQSGEKALSRTREMLNGKNIVSIEEVKPTSENHGYEPENFEPVVHLQKGQLGVWKAPDTDTPEGAVAGVEYPIHREDQTMRKFVILHAANPDADPTSVDGTDIRFYLDPEVPVYNTGGGFMEEREAEEWENDSDDDPNW